MQSLPTRTEVPCPCCGAESDKRIWGETVGYGSVAILPMKPALYGLPAWPLVCTICGYVQFFVNPDDFRETTPAIHTHEYES